MNTILTFIHTKSSSLLSQVLVKMKFSAQVLVKFEEVQWVCVHSTYLLNFGSERDYV